MAERLVILSDLWGAKKGLWITSYLGYLQQYFDIVYYDTSQLADLEASLLTAEKISAAFDNGGLERAVRNLMDSDYLLRRRHRSVECSAQRPSSEISLCGIPPAHAPGN
ncbi:MAG: hypothetical protein P8Z38_04670 [Robiginitalea sp.]